MAIPVNPPSPLPGQATGAQIDRLSDLPEHVLLQILSFLPTHIAARTSLLSGRFRYLWMATPDLHFDHSAFEHRPSHDFLNMVNRSFLHRDLSCPVLHLTIRLRRFPDIFPIMRTLLNKARSFGIRHLVIDLGYWLAEPLLPTIFSIPSLESLTFESDSIIEEPISPSLIAPAGLRSLSLYLTLIEPPVLDVILSKLPVLEDLELGGIDTVDLSSQTIKRLKLGLEGWVQDVRICIPCLELLDLSHSGSGYIKSFQLEMPLLQKAVIKFKKIFEKSADSIYEVVKAVANVQDLLIDVEEDWDHGNQFHNFAAPDMHLPMFPNLKQLELCLCFHRDNIEDLICLLQHSPAIETLKLVHKPPFVSDYKKVKKPMLWKSKLPRIAGSSEHTSFFDLHMRNIKKELIKRLTRKLTSKRQRI